MSRTMCTRRPRSGIHAQGSSGYNLAASTGKGAVQWRLTDNAATKSGIWAENHAALVRKVASCAYMVVNAVKSRHRVLLMSLSGPNTTFGNANRYETICVVSVCVFFGTTTSNAGRS